MSDARIVQRGLEQLGIDLEALRKIAGLQSVLEPAPPLVGGPVAESVTAAPPVKELPKRPGPAAPVKPTKPLKKK